jgi:glycosyltransferase involved in cell wall biosynthesis
MNQEISILFLIDSLSEGGSELALLVLVRALHKKHHRISVFVLHEPTRLAIAFREAGATLYLPGREESQSRINGFRRLIEVMSAQYFDFVHASSRNTSMFFALAFLLPNHGHRIVTFQNVHAVYISGFSKWQQIKEIILLSILKRVCDGFTTDSHANVDGYKFNAPRLRVHWIPNCLPPSINSSSVDIGSVRRSMNISLTEFLIVIPARYSAQKGHLVFFKAMKHLLSAGKPLPRVVCFGHGDQTEFLRSYLTQNRLDSMVSLNGVIPIENLQAFIISADLVAMPSLWESFGQVVAGAMALGKPVLGSDTGGIKEQLRHNRTGFLVAPGDVMAWATEIDRLMNSRSLLVDVGKAGQEAVQGSLSAEEIAQTLLDYYGNIGKTF